LAMCLPLQGRTRDLHPLEFAHAGRTKNGVCHKTNPVISRFIFGCYRLHHARRVVSRFFVLF